MLTGWIYPLLCWFSTSITQYWHIRSRPRRKVSLLNYEPIDPFSHCMRYVIAYYTHTSSLDWWRQKSFVVDEIVGLVIISDAGLCPGGKLGKNPPGTGSFRKIRVNCVSRVLPGQCRRQINANLGRSHDRIFSHSFNDIELDRLIMMCCHLWVTCHLSLLL